MRQKKRTPIERLKSLADRYSGSIFPALLLVLDYLMVVLAELLAYWLRREGLPIANEGFHIPGVYLYVIVPTIFLCFLHSANTHIRRMPVWKIAKVVFWSVFYSIVTIAMLMYFGKVAEVVSRLFVAMTGSFAFVFILFERYFLKKYLNEKGILQTPLLLVGAGQTAELVLRVFASNGGGGYNILGFIDDHPISEKLSREYRILGRFANIERVINMTGVQDVLITAPGLSPEKQVELVTRIQPLVKNVAFVPDFFGAPVDNIAAEGLGESPVMFLRVRNNMAHWYNRLLKRLFDLVLSLVGMVVVVPLGILISIAIYIDRPGPVIFAHKRVGQHGKIFPCYKFRSMIPNAQEELGKYLAEHPEAMEEWERDFKLKDDPRITKVGNFLRRTSLDELPQLINVIKGEMSLVGPRPIVTAEIEKYNDYFRDFCLVPPGITGMWQVNGRNDTTYEERVLMDSWYVRNWSVWIDMVYLLKTIGVVIKGKGAY